MKISFTFKKGEKVHLDAIYEIQGLFQELNWWEHENGDIDGNAVILKDISITITAMIE